jgi:glycogen operon protein
LRAWCSRRRWRTCVNPGIAAAELLPIHDFVDDGYLLDKALSNYWGYNTLNFFAPSRR